MKNNGKNASTHGFQPMSVQRTLTCIIYHSALKGFALELRHFKLKTGYFYIYVLGDTKMRWSSENADAYELLLLKTAIHGSQ